MVLDGAPVTAEGSARHIALALLIFTAIGFIYSFALPYLTMDAERFGIYEQRRDWLLAHIAGGTAALLLGPVQFWLGGKRHTLVHSVLGTGYVMGVAISGVTAFYLSWNNDFGWVFGMGFNMMAVTWIIATGFAVIAVCRGLSEQHREWMIRSYVVTFSFVTFRVVIEILQIARIGTLIEQLTAASWLCWTVPLVITETILQGRKIFRHPRTVRLPKYETAESVPEVEEVLPSQNTLFPI